MQEIYTCVLKRIVSEWRIIFNSPLTIEVTFGNNEIAMFTDMGKYWRTEVVRKSFITHEPGALGLRLSIIQALHVTEEVAAVTDILRSAGYTELDPLHSEWLIFVGPAAHHVCISPMSVNDDPRGLWGVYSHIEDIRRYVRDVCERVRGVDNVI